jgi:hypothetical protein
MLIHEYLHCLRIRSTRYDDFLTIKNSDSYVGRLPSRRVVWIRSVWDRKPPDNTHKILLQIGSGRYLVDNAHLRIGVTRRELSLDNVSIAG